jgi:hypothetical protein
MFEKDGLHDVRTASTRSGGLQARQAGKILLLAHPTSFLKRHSFQKDRSNGHTPSRYTRWLGVPLQDSLIEQPLTPQHCCLNPQSLQQPGFQNPSIALSLMWRASNRESWRSTRACCAESRAVLCPSCSPPSSYNSLSPSLDDSQQQRVML